MTARQMQPAAAASFPSSRPGPGPSAVFTNPGVLYEEQQFTAKAPGEADIQLFARLWRPPTGPSRAQLVLVHGYMEHGGRYRELAHALAQRAISTVCVDLRGHGRSAGPRGYVRRFDNYLTDLQATLRTFGQPPLFMLGHSLGGLIALDYVMRNDAAVRGLIVTNPYLENAMAPPAYKLWIGKQAGRFAPRLSLPAGLPLDGLTHDKILLQQHARDPLIFTSANAAWFRESNAAQIRVRRMQKMSASLLYVYSDADPIARPQANANLAAQIVATDKQILLRPGELHEVLNEVRRADLYTLIGQWIEARLPAVSHNSPRPNSL